MVYLKIEEHFKDVQYFYIKEIPTTTGKEHLYKNGGTIKDNKIHHAQQFLAAIQILSQCKFLINHTGNVARWIVKYRGSADNTIQYKAGVKLT